MWERNQFREILIKVNLANSEQSFFESYFMEFSRENAKTNSFILHNSNFFFIMDHMGDVVIFTNENLPFMSKTFENFKYID